MFPGNQEKNDRKMTNKTFTMIKPDALANGHTGNIINDITAAGFKIEAMKYLQLTQAQAEAFYAVHSERPFFRDLVNFMISGPIVAAILWPMMPDLPIPTTTTRPRMVSAISTAWEIAPSIRCRIAVRA